MAHIKNVIAELTRCSDDTIKWVDTFEISQLKYETNVDYKQFVIKTRWDNYLLAQQLKMLATNTLNKPSKKGKERMKALARKHDPNHVPNPNYKITKAEPDTSTTKAAQDDKTPSNNSSNNQQATQPHLPYLSILWVIGYAFHKQVLHFRCWHEIPTQSPLSSLATLLYILVIS